MLALGEGLREQRDALPLLVTAEANRGWRQVVNDDLHEPCLVQ